MTVKEKPCLVGESKSLLPVRNAIGIAGNQKIPVIITGETGVGKDLVAKMIHLEKHASLDNFHSLNCSTVPSELMDSILFGHVKGAFTGAISSQAGYFEVASGGTLFLDEIGEMSPSFQAKILRVLEDNYVVPLGGREKKEIETRIIVGTNASLETMVQQKKFRRDLYFRLFGVPIHIPALRERKSDIMPIWNYYISEVAKAEEILTHESAQKILLRHQWSGNVRELFAVARLALLLKGEEKLIQKKHLMFPSI